MYPTTLLSITFDGALNIDSEWFSIWLSIPVLIIGGVLGLTVFAIKRFSRRWK